MAKVQPISGQTVKYTELVEHFAETHKERKADARRILDDVFNFIAEGLRAGHSVATPLGKFKRADKKAKSAVKAGETRVNPFTKEKYITTAKKAVRAGPPVAKFTPNKALKDKLV